MNLKDAIILWGIAILSSILYMWELYYLFVTFGESPLSFILGITGLFILIFVIMVCVMTAIDDVSITGALKKFGGIK